MMENHSNTPIVIGVIGHVNPKFLEEVREEIKAITNLKVIFFKESNGKLWVVSEERRK